MPMNFAGSLALSASDVIGKVEVLEPKMTSGTTACALAVASAFTLRSSNTASTIEIDAGQRAVVGGRGDARQHGVALRRGARGPC